MAAALAAVELVFAKFVSNAVQAVGLSMRKGLVVDVATNFLDELSEGISRFADKLSSAFKIVKEFGRKVIYVFREIWDEVVGHSWWPDTVDGVIEYSKKLQSGVQPSLDSFEKSVSTTFERVLDGMQNMDSREVAIDFRLKISNFKRMFSR